MFRNNLVALGVTLAIAFGWLRVNDFAAHKDWVSSSLSRKIIHIGTGPIFVLCWLFFNESQFSPHIAVLVPLGIITPFTLAGTGIIKDPSDVKAMSRIGDRREILRGPLFYGLAFVMIMILFWRSSTTGIVVLMILYGGDGLADIVGNWIDSLTLPWSPKKSLAEPITMLYGIGFAPVLD